MYANLVILNGKVYSLDLGMNRITGTAVAVADGKIISVGSDEEMISYITATTQVIDAGGHTILPGLCDDHCHASFTASSIIACDLFNVFPTAEDTRQDIMNIFQNRIREYIQSHPDVQIIRGTGWNLGVFSGCGWPLPSRQELDEVCRDKPLVMESFCQHNLWVNTKAIQLAGLDEATPTPASGTIPREEDGYPSGLFQEMSAMALIRENLPGYDYTVEQYKDTIKYYQKNLANYYGITLINDVLFTENAREAYKQLAQQGELTLRVRGVYDIDYDGFMEKFKDVVNRKGSDNVNDLFEINTIKVFMEGEFCMCEPYELQVTESMGLPADYTSHTFWPMNDSNKLFLEAMKHGFQIHVHAMGDCSVKQTIESLEFAQKQYGNQGRNIIAHLMAIKPEDMVKGGELKLVASCQPRWMVYDTDIAGFCIPYFSEKRTLDFYPNKRLRNAGWVVAYGTDFPVTPPPNPFHEIQCGITRTVFPDAPDYEPYKGLVLGTQENQLVDVVSLEESIQSLTIHGAYQNFLENITGSIEVGKSAELVILNCDIEEVPIDEIYLVSVDKTIFRGRVVYEV